MLVGLIPPPIGIKEVKNKGCTNTGCQVTMAIIFCTVVALFNIQSGVLRNLYNMSTNKKVYKILCTAQTWYSCTFHSV